MNNPLMLLIAILTVGCLAFVIRQSAILATRLDRLHWRILTTRDSLALLLDERARYGQRIAEYPDLPSAVSAEVSSAACACVRR